MEILANSSSLKKCVLSPENSDIELEIAPNGYEVQNIRESGFEWLWKAAKANFGISSGKYMFEVRIKELVDPVQYTGQMHQEKKKLMQETLNLHNQKHIVRVGFSSNSASMNLGSDLEGVGYDNRGLKIYGGQQRNYGTQWNVGDVIRCCIDLQENFVVYYFKNGENLGAAFQIPLRYHKRAFYPHVCIRNAVVEVNFGNTDGFEAFKQTISHDTIAQTLIANQISLEDSNLDPTAVLEKLNRDHQESQNRKLTTTIIPVDNPVIISEGDTSVGGGALKANKFEEDIEKIMKTTEQQAAINMEKGEEGKEGKVEQEVEVTEEQNNQISTIAQENTAIHASNEIIDLRIYKIHINEYKYMDEASEEVREYIQSEPETFKECTCIFMIGLPCSGKTTLATSYMKSNPEKKYSILSTSQIFDHIINTVRFRTLKGNLIPIMEICAEILEKTLPIAAAKKRNYIIDQCNVLLKGRVQKLHIFDQFRKEAHVLVLTDAEQSSRASKKARYLNKKNLAVPKLSNESNRNLQENFILPDTECEGFDAILYKELDEEKAHKVVILLNERAKLQAHPLLREKNFVDIEKRKSGAPATPSTMENFQIMKSLTNDNKLEIEAPAEVVIKSLSYDQDTSLNSAHDSNLEEISKASDTTIKPPVHYSTYQTNQNYKHNRNNSPQRNYHRNSGGSGSGSGYNSYNNSKFQNRSGQYNNNNAGYNNTNLGGNNSGRSYTPHKHGKSYNHSVPQQGQSRGGGMNNNNKHNNMGYRSGGGRNDYYQNNNMNLMNNARNNFSQQNPSITAFAPMIQQQQTLAQVQPQQQIQGKYLANQIFGQMQQTALNRFPIMQAQPQQQLIPQQQPQMYARPNNLQYNSNPALNKGIYRNI